MGICLQDERGQVLLYRKVRSFYRKNRFIIQKWADRIYEDSVPVYAAQATFYIIIASIPFLMLLTTLVRFFIPITRADLTAAAVAFFPDSFESFITQVIGELYIKSPASIISVAAVTALWSASRGIAAVRCGLNRVYHVEGSRNYVKSRGMSLVYTLIFVVLIIFCLAILVFGNSILSVISGKFPAVGRIVGGFLQVKSLISIVLLSLFFTSLYTFLPAHKVTFRGQIPGAMVAAIGWTLFSYFYGIYIENYSNYSYIYGSLAAIVLLMLWMYFCLILILIGAEVNEFVDEHVIRAEKEPSRRKIRRRLRKKDVR